MLSHVRFFICDASALAEGVRSLLIPGLLLFLTGNMLAAVFPAWPAAHFSVAGPFICILLGIACVSLRQPEKRSVFRVVLWLIILLVGSLHYTSWHFRPPANDISAWIVGSATNGARIDPQNVEIEGLIDSPPFNRRMILQVRRINGHPVTGRVLADLPYSRHPNRTQDADRLEAGRSLVITGALMPPFRSPVPGTFNQQAYLNAQGVTALLKYPDSLHLLTLSNAWPYPLQRFTDGLKRRIAGTFSRALPSPQSEILGGLVLGDKAIPVDRETKQAFIDTGLIHVLAASGVNVGIIAGAIYWLLALCKVPVRLRLFLAMAAVGFYSLLTGLPPSIQRAAAMLELALFLKLLNRELSGVFLLCLASSVLVWLHPDNITSVGFQFSVLTTFGLLTMLPPLQARLGYYITQWLAGLLLVPAVAQLWILPLSIAYFNRFPLHTIPFNIAALALITPLTLAGFTAAVLSLGIPSAAMGLIGLTRPLIDALLLLARWGEGMRWAQWSLASPTVWEIGLLYSALFIWLFLLWRLKNVPVQRALSPKTLLLGLLPFFLLLGGLSVKKFQRFQHNELDLLPLSIGREACLIKPAGGQERILLLPERLRFGESRTLSDFLRHRQVQQVKLVVLLPEENTGTHVRKGPNYLKAALANLRIEWLFVVETGRFSISNIVHAQAFPKTGLNVALSDFYLTGTPQTFRLNAGSFCLLDKMATVSHSSCSLHWLAGSRTQLLAKLPLDARRYYHVEQVGTRLFIESEK